MELTWTMNCILFGAEVIKLIKDGKLKEARGKILNLSSEFDDKKTDHLMMRLSKL